jgi:hypothetical protein
MTVFYSDDAQCKVSKTGHIVFESGYGLIGTNDPLPVNCWCHVACQYQDNNLNIFVNGQKMREGNAVRLTAREKGWYFGAKKNVIQQPVEEENQFIAPLCGELADIMLTHSVLSDRLLEAIALKDKYPDDEHILFLLKCNEGTGNMLRCSQGTAKDATIVGDVGFSGSVSDHFIFKMNAYRDLSICFA